MSDEDEVSLLIISLAKMRGVIMYGKFANNKFTPIGENMKCEYSGTSNVVGEPMDYKFVYNSKRPMVIIDIENEKKGAKK